MAYFRKTNMPFISSKKVPMKGTFSFLMAGVIGFEPMLMSSEPTALPLGYTPRIVK